MTGFGGLLVLVGAVLALPQVFTAAPAQVVFCVGVLLAIAGGVLLVDHAPRRHR
jgi:hypothetical protein